MHLTMKAICGIINIGGLLFGIGAFDLALWAAGVSREPWIGGVLMIASAPVLAVGALLYFNWTPTILDPIQKGVL